MKKDTFYLGINFLILALIWIAYGVTLTLYDSFGEFLSLTTLSYLVFICCLNIVVIVSKKLFIE